MFQHHALVRPVISGRGRALGALLIGCTLSISPADASALACPGTMDAGAESAPERKPARYRIWGELIVRTPMDSADLRELRSQVAGVWARYGVRIAWHRRPPPVLLPDGYSGWVRILIEANGTDHVVARNPRDPPLAALHMPGGVPRNVIYVSLDAARALVRRATLGSVPPVPAERLAARLAGRAVAHELGHYLLGTAAHSADGLMRRTFTASDVLEKDSAKFRLTPLEAQCLAGRLLLGREQRLARR
jgi:hypothetical protein